VSLPLIPAGEARVWFYRPVDAYDSLNTPYIRMNDAIVGISVPNGASYRDVPAGQYHIAVDSYGKDFGRTRTLSSSCDPGSRVAATAALARVPAATTRATPSMSG
jgi:hypothetical protein